MPTLSVFYGITVSMYREKGSRHHIPHIHAKYGEYTAEYDFNGDRIEGFLPAGKEKIIIAWIEIHREDPNANWELLVQGQPAFRIDPLR